MHYHVFTIFIVLFIQIFSSKPISTTKAPDPKKQWDLLIFTQHWPLTVCSQWEERGTNNTCAFPDPQDLWTIHGIWPTKEGTKGPTNCNNTWHFNATLIEPIESELEKYWTNVEKNTQLTSLWKHEWTKHGTCAAILPQLSNELKYFQQGLQWIQTYNMKKVLSTQNIIPNKQGYTVQQISNAVKSVLNKNPIIQCVIDKYTKQSLISEIRICFDKGLSLVDCDTVKYLEDDVVKDGDVLTNCNLQKPVIYLDKITPYTTTTVSTTSTVTTTVPTSSLDLLYKTRKRLLAFYRTIQFLIWLSI